MSGFDYLFASGYQLDVYDLEMPRVMVQSDSVDHRLESGCHTSMGMEHEILYSESGAVNANTLHGRVGRSARFGLFINSRAFRLSAVLLGGAIFGLAVAALGTIVILSIWGAAEWLAIAMKN